MKLARIGFGLLFAAATACLPPPPAERATDAARQLNVAARFGRVDIAVSHTAKGARPTFLKRRADWGKGLRVVDVELAGVQMSDPTTALFFVDVSWVRDDESVLRRTRVAQLFQDKGEGWKLTREHRVNGDLGLFGEKVAKRPEQAPKDVHFPSKTIR